MAKNSHICVSTGTFPAGVAFKVAKVASRIRIMSAIDGYDDDLHLQKITRRYIPASQRKTTDYNYLLLHHHPMNLILLAYQIFPKYLHYLVLIHSCLSADTQLITVNTH
jgi:hypothetical protein